MSRVRFQPDYPWESPDYLGYDRGYQCASHPIDDYPREQPSPYGFERGRDPVIRPHHNPDAQVLPRVRIEAPSFMGQLDPYAYLDWEADMNYYFDWYEMSEERKIRFAKMRLIDQAKYYWQNVERLILHRRLAPINTWESMKDRLREKYVPTSYLHHLMDQWERLTQGSQTVTEYIARFDEYFMRCRVREHLSTTLSRFRAGLRYDLYQELVRHKFHSLGEAYQFAEDCERFRQLPVTRQPESPYLDTFVPRIPQPDCLQTPIPHLPPQSNKDQEIPVENLQESQELSPVESQSQDMHPAETEEVNSEILLAGVENPETPLVEEESPESPLEEEIYIADPELEEIYEEQKIEGCKEIEDNVSCIHDEPTETQAQPDLIPIELPSLHQVAQLDALPRPVKYPCLISLDFDPYQNFIESHTVPQNVESLVRGEPWLTDQKVVQQSQSYPSSIPNQGKEMPFNLSPFRSLPGNDPLEFKGKKRSPHNFGAKEIDKKHRSHHPGRPLDLLSVFLVPVWLLDVKEISLRASSHHPQEPVDFILPL